MCESAWRARMQPNAHPQGGNPWETEKQERRKQRRRKPRWRENQGLPNPPYIKIILLYFPNFTCAHTKQCVDNSQSTHPTLGEGLNYGVCLLSQHPAASIWLCCYCLINDPSGWTINSGRVGSCQFHSLSYSWHLACGPDFLKKCLLNDEWKEEWMTHEDKLTPGLDRTKAFLGSCHKLQLRTK